MTGVATGLLMLCAATLAGAAEPFVERVFIRDAFVVASVRAAREGALRRLARPRCRAVFADFRDTDGRLLYERLLELGQSGRDYFASLPFFDGTNAPTCFEARAIAFTSPGQRQVMICGRAFHHARQTEPRFSEAVLIHEALHTLGLGEDPPSSREITRQVLKRCGWP
jgi:hypothetical protein